MSRQVQLPLLSEVRARLETLRADPGARVTVLALARACGLSNTTFRRNFPDVVADITAAAPTTSDTAVHRPGSDRHGTQLRRLRRDNQNLRSQFDLACAQIQHLTLLNEQLRDRLHSAVAITRIPPGSTRI